MTLFEDTCVSFVCCSVASHDFIQSILCRYFDFFRKDEKKVGKLEAQIPFHDSRGNKEEVEKIKQKIQVIWDKTREAAYAM